MIDHSVRVRIEEQLGIVSSRRPMNQVAAPWTPDQIASLNAFQQDGRMHEFTCNVGACPVRTLEACEDGWFCPGCDYGQHWAYDWMADWSWQGMLDQLSSEMTSA